MSIPQDDAFYTRLIQMGHTIGAKPEDLLVVMASETNLDPSTTKNLPFRGLNTMGLEFAQSAGITTEEWSKLPEMSATENLPYSEKFFKYLLKLAGRDHFVNALDLYLSNAAYGIWAHPPIKPDTVMYGGGPGDPWKSNYPMDNYPAAVGKDLTWAKNEIGKSLKGYVSVEDLRRFMLRDNVQPTWQGAIKKLRSVMATAGLEVDSDYIPVTFQQPNGYTPDTSYDEINADQGITTHVDGTAAGSGSSGIPSWLKWLGLGALGIGTVVIIKNRK